MKKRMIRLVLGIVLIVGLLFMLMYVSTLVERIYTGRATYEIGDPCSGYDTCTGGSCENGICVASSSGGSVVVTSCTPPQVLVDGVCTSPLTSCTPTASCESELKTCGTIVDDCGDTVVCGDVCGECPPADYMSCDPANYELPFQSGCGLDEILDENGCVTGCYEKCLINKECTGTTSLGSASLLSSIFNSFLGWFGVKTKSATVGAVNEPQCSDGEVCVSDNCVTTCSVDEPCDKGECVNDVCAINECSVDEPCDFDLGEFDKMDACFKASCEGGKCLIESSCNKEEYCNNGVCKPKRCDSHGKCDTLNDVFCINGLCEKTCVLDDSCPSGEECVEGEIMNPSTDVWEKTCQPIDCEVNVDCDDGDECTLDRCFVGDDGGSCAFEVSGECGGCEDSRGCGSGEICGEGECIIDNILCTVDVAPVCGEYPNGDKATFSNDCEAGRARASVISNGECVFTCDTEADCPGVGAWCIGGVCGWDATVVEDCNVCDEDGICNELECSTHDYILSGGGLNVQESCYYDTEAICQPGERVYIDGEFGRELITCVGGETDADPDVSFSCHRCSRPDALGLELRPDSWMENCGGSVVEETCNSCVACDNLGSSECTKTKCLSQCNDAGACYFNDLGWFANLFNDNCVLENEACASISDCSGYSLSSCGDDVCGLSRDCVVEGDECVEDDIVCADVVILVCGTYPNGGRETFNNECELRKAGAIWVSDGACVDDELISGCTDSDGGFNYGVKGEAVLISEPSLLLEAGLGGYDGLAVTSPTTATWKLDEVIREVTLGDDIVTSVVNPKMSFKVNKITYYTPGNVSNNIEIISTMTIEDKCEIDNITLLESACNDNRPGIIPQLYECPNECLNGACVGVESTCIDIDNDGYDTCDDVIDGLDVDCDDGDDLINPSADEVCDDGVDNNCDGLVDEGCVSGTCTDSDGGVNIFEKGNIFEEREGVGPNNEEDSCVISTGPGAYISLADNLCEGSDCYVKEYFCEMIVSVEVMNIDFISCPNGCEDGECVVELSGECTDSDGGPENYFEKGIVEASIREYVITEGELGDSEVIVTSNNQARLSIVGVTKDIVLGGRAYTFGDMKIDVIGIKYLGAGIGDNRVILNIESSYEDKCGYKHDNIPSSNPNDLSEKGCGPGGNGNSQERTYTCPNGCEDGACVEDVPIKSCQNSGGDICTIDEVCNGILLEASDSDRCCDEVCEPAPVCNTCASCDGFLDTSCNYDKCTNTCNEGSAQCYFRDLSWYANIFGLDDCIPLTDKCDVADECADYSLESCEDNPCRDVRNAQGLQNGCIKKDIDDDGVKDVCVEKNVAVDVCGGVSTEIKDEVDILKELVADWVLVTKEGKDLHENNYVVVGDSSDSYLMELVDVNNASTGYWSDRARFRDVLMGDVYETIWTSEGVGTITIGGKSYGVTLSGNSMNSSEEFIVRLDYPGTGVVDFSECFEVDVCGGVTTELKNKVNEVKGMLIDDEKIIFKEGEDIHYRDYVVVGNSSDSYLMELVDVKNSSVGYTVDKARFRNVVSNEVIDTLWTSEGVGILTLEGLKCQVILSGDSDTAKEDYIVTINCEPYNEIVDFSECFDAVAPSICEDFDEDGYDICAIGEQGDDGNVIDCNDTDADISPGDIEICGDLIDNDCDGEVDETDDCGEVYDLGSVDDGAKTKKIARKDKIKFERTSKDRLSNGHKLRITEIEDDFIRVRVQSQPQELDLVVGESVDVDLDGDEIKDIVVSVTTPVDGEFDFVVGPYDDDGDGYYLPFDCNDSDALIYPNATELCDGIDNNCYGGVDEGCSCNANEARACGTSAVGACVYGNQNCTNVTEGIGIWNTCFGNVEPIGEKCDDGVDNDCDGSVDEGCSSDSLSSGGGGPSRIRPSTSSPGTTTPSSTTTDDESEDTILPDFIEENFEEFFQRGVNKTDLMKALSAIGLIIVTLLVMVASSYLVSKKFSKGDLKKKGKSKKVLNKAKSLEKSKNLEK